MFNRHFRPEISDIKQARSVLYISLALLVWMPSYGVVYNTDSTITTVLLRHFIAMIQTSMRDTIRLLECRLESIGINT